MENMSDPFGSILSARNIATFYNNIALLFNGPLSTHRHTYQKGHFLKKKKTQQTRYLLANDHSRYIYLRSDVNLQKAKSTFNRKFKSEWRTNIN